MFQIKEESISRLLEASQTLHGKLVSSPLWEYLKTEPVIMEWISSLQDVESQIKKSQEVKS